MKLNTILAISLAALAFAACDKFEEAAFGGIQPAGGSLTEAQMQATNSVIPSRVDASFSGMFTAACEPLHIPFSSSRPDNFGFAMMDYSNDLEGADIMTVDSGYNWFSACMELSSRDADYANPYIRYKTPYDIIAIANTVIKSYGTPTDPEVIAKLAQTKAMRAYCYMRLAPYYQYSYATAKDQPCVPIVTEETTDFANNPRATVGDVYKQIKADLDFAVNNLEGYVRPNKSLIDRQVAYGLRARVNLEMGNWDDAYKDAVAAADGYEPASYEEVSVPSFKDINEHNWLWGYDMTTDMANTYPMATSSAWVRSFSAVAYSCAVQCYACCNILLYNKIDDADIRKQWFVDKDLNSTLLTGLVWPGKDKEGKPFTDVANADDGGDTKVPYLPYTNVKFGCNTVGTTLNDEDWPYMRVEEMILIQAEAQARLGNEGVARTILENFVNGYRFYAGAGYSSSASGRNIIDEIWFQRRVELWGEGFFLADAHRLNKNIVRFHAIQNHGDKSDSNMPNKFRFNLSNDDPWGLLRFCTDEKNANAAIIDNTGGAAPVTDQNPDLLDGVTD